MYEQIREDIFFILFYGIVTAMAMMASCYLLFRQGNAFAADITSPVRLRRWTAAFFAAFALSHMWYMPIFFLTSSEDIEMADLIGGVLDSLTVFPLLIIVLFVMLQDRRRPLWPVGVMMLPLLLGNTINAVTRSYVLLPMLYAYFLLMCIGLTIYMVRALRQYGRWLRDNYADLEHKEVWQSFVVLAIILLVFAFYAFIYQGPAYRYGMQLVGAVLIGYLLWRVETLGSLTSAPSPPLRGGGGEAVGPLLQKYCIDTGLYLQHDLTLLQLAKAVGTNRFYLSQYFSCLGTNYNAYINDLRIRHFVRLYREAVAVKQPFTAQQLAAESGFHHYRTFSNAFKHQTGQTVTSWIKAQQGRGEP